MATFTTALFDAQDTARANTSRLAAPNIASGEIEFARIPYTLAGTEAANDVIKLGVLPAGAIPIPQLSEVFSADPGTTLTLDVGTADDPNGFADTIVLSAGGKVNFTSGTAPAWLTQTPVVPDSGSGNAVLYATVKSANTLTASVVLYFLIAFKRGR